MLNKKLFESTNFIKITKNVLLIFIIEFINKSFEIKIV